MRTMLVASSAILLSACQVGAPSLPVNSSPTQGILNEFQQQMRNSEDLAVKGDVKAQQQTGRWLASAGMTEQAEPLLRAAAEKHQPDAQYQLGLLISPHNKTESKTWLAAAAESGHHAAAQQLASSYRNGKLFTDKQLAFSWLLMAAHQGNAQAANDVGAAYSRGEGVKKSPELAVGWYRRAAEQGHALAQFNLAGAYQVGEGVKPQPAMAFAWYSLAQKNSRDVRLKQVAEQMKLRMYAAAARSGALAQAHEAEKQLSGQFAAKSKEKTL